VGEKMRKKRRELQSLGRARDDKQVIIIISMQNIISTGGFTLEKNK